jgi:uncharacterized protein YjdB
MISLNERSANLTVGDTLQLLATLSPSTSAGAFSFSSSDGNIARVDKTGLVTAISEGATVITVATYNNKSQTCAITVKGKGLPQSVTLDAEEKSLLTGAVTALAASLPRGTASDIAFTSSDPSVVAVQSPERASDERWTCALSCLKAGTATITARTANGKTDSCRVTVYDELSLDAVTGKSADGLTGGAVTWTANASKGKASLRQFRFQIYKDQGAAPVADSGFTAGASYIYTPVYPGTYRATCMARDGLSPDKTRTSGDVAVSARPLTIASVTPNTLYALVNGKVTVAVSASGGVGTLTYRYGVTRSGAQYLAMSTGTGPSFSFTGTQEGDYVVTVLVTDAIGQTADMSSASIAFRPPVATINITAPCQIIDLSQQDKAIQLSAACLPASASQAVVWTSSKTAVATVNAAGLVTGVAPGAASITATAADGSGVYARVEVQVEKSGFLFTGLEDGVCLTAYTGEGGAVVIPATVLGQRVVALASGLFRDNEAVTRVTVPGGVSEIPAECFSGCVNLASVTLPPSVQILGEDAFSGCTSLAEIAFSG